MRENGVWHGGRCNTGCGRRSRERRCRAHRRARQERATLGGTHKDLGEPPCPRRTRRYSASRPERLGEGERLPHRRDAGAGPKDGQVLVRNVCLSVDPYMRGRMSDAQVLCGAGQDRRGDGRRHRRRGRRVEATRSSRPVTSSSACRLAEYARRPTAAGLRKVDPTPRPLSAYLGVRRHAWRHGLVSACSTSASRSRARRSSSRRRGGRGRQRRRPDRQDHGLPRRRHRRRHGEVRLRRRRARLRRLHRLQGAARLQRRARGGAARTASTSTSRTSAARSSTRCCAHATPSRASRCAA